MKPRIKLITLGVDDLERSLRFNRDGMGLETKGNTGQRFEHGSVMDIHMNDDLILALWPAASLSMDANVTATPNAAVGQVRQQEKWSRSKTASATRRAEQPVAGTSASSSRSQGDGIAGRLAFRDADVTNETPSR